QPCRRADESNITTVRTDRWLPGTTILRPIHSHGHQFSSARLTIMHINVARIGLAAAGTSSSVIVPGDEISSKTSKGDVTTIGANRWLDRKTVGLSSITSY